MAKKIFIFIIILFILSNYFISTTSITCDENDFTLTEEIVKDVFQSWQNKFFKQTSNGIKIGNYHFWEDAEMMEIILDAYETTGFKEYEELFRQTYARFYKDKGDHKGNWLSNDFNDDLMWITIVCVRAYLLFGDQEFLDIAKFHFDDTYKRAYLDDIGLLRWKENHNNGVNSCVNGPAIIAACYIGEATRDQSYFTIAESLYAAQKKYLCNPSGNGQVYDSYTKKSGEINKWTSTYNQGTFLGAATMLYQYFKDDMYMEDAHKTAEYTRVKFAKNGVINWEDSGNDLPGFKGILMRYMRKYIITFNAPDKYIDWMYKNVESAYKARNSFGIIYSGWGKKTTENYNDAFGASTAVSLMVNTPLSVNIEYDPYNEIASTSMTYIKGMYTSNTEDSYSKKYLNNINNNDYAEYMNVNFGEENASFIELYVNNIASDSVGIIEIRKNSMDGPILGTVQLSDFVSESETSIVGCEMDEISGNNNIYIVFKNDNQSDISICNFLGFKFMKDTPDWYISYFESMESPPKANNNLFPILLILIIAGTISFSSVYFCLRRNTKK